MDCDFVPSYSLSLAITFVRTSHPYNNFSKANTEFLVTISAGWYSTSCLAQKFIQIFSTVQEYRADNISDS